MKIWQELFLFLSESEVAQSCPTLSDPMDYSLPGSPIPGILQARTLEWVAISFSSAGKWKVKVKSLSRVRLLATPWIIAYQAPPSMGFSRQERVPELVAFILKDYLNTYFLCEDYPGISLPRQSTIFSSVFGKYWSQCPQCINSDWHTHKSINTYLLTEWRKNSSEEEK